MKRRIVTLVLGVALVHLVFSVYALLSSLYFTFPGEPGFDPVLAQRADAFSNVLNILGFPILSLIQRLPSNPLFSGVIGWVWFALNSLVWGLIVGALYKWVRDRRLGVIVESTTD